MPFRSLAGVLHRAPYVKRQQDVVSLRQAINALGLVGGFLQGVLGVATQGTGTSSGEALGVGTSVSQVTAGMAVSAATLAADPMPPAGMAASAAGADADAQPKAGVAAASASADADAQPALGDDTQSTAGVASSAADTARSRSARRLTLRRTEAFTLLYRNDNGSGCASCS